MLKTILNVVLLTTAQNAFAINLQEEEICDSDRPMRIPRGELRHLILEELDTGVYNIGEEAGQCSRKQVLRVLRQYFKREYRCYLKFDECGVNTNENWLRRCLIRNDYRKEERLEGCMLEDAVSEEIEEDQTQEGEGQGSGERTCVGVNVAIPNSCEAFTCDIVKDVYDYTNTRVFEHNTRRRRHFNTPDVALNLDIACQAKKWSDYMANSGNFGHSQRQDRQSPHQGENLGMAGTSGALGEYTPEKGWYESEIVYYDYETGDFVANAPADAQIGHFTQMVWDDTTNIGCGESRIQRGGWWYVYSTCRYNPPGNYVGTYTDHVHELRPEFQ